MSGETATLTRAQRRVLQLVFDEHHEHGVWPRFGTLDRRLARSKVILDLGQVVRDLPDDLLRPLWSGGVRPESEAEMRLTAQGMALCEGAEGDLELFLRTLRWISKRELAFEPRPPEHDEDCEVRGRQLMRAFRLHVSRRPDVERLGHLLHVEHWGQRSASSNGWDWRFTVSRDVRRFAKVQSIEDYVAARRAWLDESALPEVVGGESTYVAEMEPATQPRREYIAEYLIEQVRSAAAAHGWNGDKLADLLNELNDNYIRGNPYATHALVRAVLDHVPPLFGHKTFDQVVSNVAWSRTDRNYMKKLLDFRHQADDALHRQISTSNHHLAMDDLPSAVPLRTLLAQACPA